MMEMHLDPNKRHDFVLLFDVTNGNPNGNPDAGNMPRIDPETNYGFVTDVALKRKIRDYAALVEDQNIFIQSKTALNSLYFEAMKDNHFAFPEVKIEDEEFLEWLLEEATDVFEIDDEAKIVKYVRDLKQPKDIMAAVDEVIDDVPKENKEKLKKLANALVAAQKGLKISSTDRELIKAYMAKKYYDIRLFGAVLTAGTNAGQIRGPVQLTFAKSESPVLPLDVSITRVAITRESDKRNKQTEMGRKAIIPYGLYRAHGFYNPKLAERLTPEGNPISENDLKILWDALYNMFEYDRSAARGEMTCRGLYIFSHGDEKGRGNAPAHKLFDTISVKLNDDTKPPRAFSGYTVTLAEKLPDKVELVKWPI